MSKDNKNINVNTSRLTKREESIKKLQQIMKDIPVYDIKTKEDFEKFFED